MLKLNHFVSLTTHGDGKLTAEMTTKEQVDRLLVLISGVATEQLLDVPKLSSGTAEAQAAAVVQLVKEWGIEDCVAAVCFDRTVSNIGHC